MDIDKYQRLVEKLYIYLKLDLTSLLSQHMHFPKKAYFEAIYKIFRYLKGSPRRDLFFKKNKTMG